MGAGPGNPELLTLRAARLIATADCILHDDLVTEAVLDQARAHAVILNVGKRCGLKKMTQEWINDEMIRLTSQGKSVVRLKSGDPMLFGRATEEMDALRCAGRTFEVVPGVSAAFAAASLLQLSLTDRSTASKLIFVTAHHSQHASPSIATDCVASDATLVIYMPGSDYSELSTCLHKVGLNDETECHLVSNVGRPCQSFVTSTLAGLTTVAPQPPPSLLIVHVRHHHNQNRAIQPPHISSVTNGHHLRS